MLRAVLSALAFVLATMQLVAMELDFQPSVGHVGETYYAEPVANGAMYPLTLELGSGELPPGLSITEGAILGVPTSTGEYPVSLNVRDAAGSTELIEGTIVIEAAIPGGEFVVNFESSSTGGLNGTFGVVEVEAAGQVALRNPSTMPGYENARFCHNQDDPPTFGGKAAVAELSSGEEASLQFSFPVPIDEVEVSVAAGEGQMMFQLGGSGSTMDNGIYNCDWLVETRASSVSGPTPDVVEIRLEGYSTRAVGFVDHVVGRRLNCSTPLPPRSPHILGDRITAGRLVYVWWSEYASSTARTLLSADADGVKLAFLGGFGAQRGQIRETSEGGWAAFTTAPSAEPYTLQLRMLNISACPSPSGLVHSRSSHEVVRNYRVEPGLPPVQQPLSIYTPLHRAAPGTVLKLQGTGFLISLDEAKARNRGSVLPSVQASYQYRCSDGSSGFRNYHSLDVLNVEPERLLIVPPDPCGPERRSDPFVAHLTVTNALGESVTVDAEISYAAPRTRGTSRR